MKKHTTGAMDMCHGPLGKNLLLFSIPLMFSNVLQVLFNLSDVAVVGHFAGAIALGSVGSTTILVTLTTGLLLGMAGGVNAVTARYLGAQDHTRVEKAVHSAFILCLAVGILLLLAGFLFTRPVLSLLGTKNELIDGAALYLTIYLCGSPALAMYNYGNAILSAVGDTKRPLIYLAVSGAINIVLNLCFVLGLHLDVAGVALASIISQYISAALVLHHLLVSREEYRLQLKLIRLDRHVASQILRIGIPSAIQYSLFAIANLFVQGAVNTFDHVVVEGNSAAVNADSIVFDMMSAFYTATTSFVAQNYGAGNKKRIMKVYGITTAYSFGLGLVLGALLFFFRVPFLSLFTTDPDVLHYGSIRLSVMGFSYCISAFMDNAAGAARGIGKSIAPTIIVISGAVILRIAWIYTIFAWFGTLPSLYLLYACSWCVTSIIGNLYFFHCYRRLSERNPIAQVHI